MLTLGQNVEESRVPQEKVHFDKDLPHYGTNGGVHRGRPEEASATFPAAMLAEALETCLESCGTSGYFIGPFVPKMAFLRAVSVRIIFVIFPPENRLVRPEIPARDVKKTATL